MPAYPCALQHVHHDWQELSVLNDAVFILICFRHHLLHLPAVQKSQGDYADHSQI
jgi:hypothetical protein